VRSEPWAPMNLLVEGRDQDLTVVLRVVPEVYRDYLPLIMR